MIYQGLLLFTFFHKNQSEPQSWFFNGMPIVKPADFTDLSIYFLNNFIGAIYALDSWENL